MNNPYSTDPPRNHAAPPPALRGITSGRQRHHSRPNYPYRILAAATTATEAVELAGGWLADRVREGWRISALIADTTDTTTLALEVLGVDTIPPTPIALSAYDIQTCGLAILGCRSLEDPRIRSHVLTLLHRGVMEISVFGDTCPPELSHKLVPVSHHLSQAATALRKYALAAVNVTESHPHQVEQLRRRRFTPVR
jgi:hypothetical protein